MKTNISTIILILFALLSYSQSKTEFGITTEGSWDFYDY